MNIKHRQEVIYEILLATPEARDKDNVLLSELWKAEFYICGWDIGDFSAEQFLRLLVVDDLSKPEGITRCRRKLQELHPELRGKAWKERHKHQEEVKAQLKSML